MKKILKSRDFILAALLVSAVSLLSCIAYSEANVACNAANSACQELKTPLKGQMFWDILPQQFVSVLFH